MKGIPKIILNLCVPKVINFHLLEIKKENLIFYNKEYDNIKFEIISVDNFSYYKKNINYIMKKLWFSYLVRGDVGLVAINNNKIIGVCWVSINRTEKMKKYNYFPLNTNSGWFHSNYVDPEWRGKGLQKHMICKLADYIGENLNYFVNINKNNIISLNNYLKLGFTKIGNLKVFKWLSFSFTKVYYDKNIQNS